MSEEELTRSSDWAEVNKWIAEGGSLRSFNVFEPREEM